MNVIALDTNQIPFDEVRRGRVHMIRRKKLPLDTGVLGLNIEFSYVVVPDGYYTPAHRHNFDQIRHTLTGLQSTGHGDLAPGECGYFPEGVHYGPQKQEGDCTSLVLQFQGPSGYRFLSNEEMNVTYNKMIAAGELAGAGLDKTHLIIVADPTITTHVIEVRARGAFGSFTFVEDILPTESNPKTGMIVGMAVVKAVRQLSSPLVIGL